MSEISKKINYALNSGIRKEIAFKMAFRIKDIKQFQYAVLLADSITDKNKLKIYAYAACSNNLQNSKYYKQILAILYKENDINNLYNLVKVLCNEYITTSDCQESILRLLESSKDETPYILLIAEKLLINNKIDINPLIYKKIMNLNKIIMAKLISIMNNPNIDNETLLNIISDIIVNNKDIIIIEDNLSTLIDLLEEIEHIKNKDTIDTLLHLILKQVNEQPQRRIKINLPDKIEIYSNKKSKIIIFKK